MSLHLPTNHSSESMLINLTNHPSSQWTKEQRDACSDFDGIVDLDFPLVDPAWDETKIARVADDICSHIANIKGVEAIHVAGEHTLTFAIVARLLQAGYRCLTSTTERRSIDLPDGRIIKAFRFVRLRDYRL